MAIDAGVDLVIRKYKPVPLWLILQTFHFTGFEKGGVALLLYFYYYRTMGMMMAVRPTEEEVTRFADMFSAMGTGPRLRIMRVLLSAHPDGMIASDIGGELAIPASTLSHHLEKLKNEGLVKIRREGTYLWYSANADVLQELLGFLYAECCTRNKAIEPQAIVRLCK